MKKVIRIERFLNEFNIEFNEPDTYFLVYEDGSRTVVSKKEADYQFELLQNRKQNNMKVNVLGTEYDVNVLEEPDETMKAMNCDGYTDNSIRLIRVLKNKEDDDVTKQKNRIIHQNIVLKHELIHAFLYECGIDSGMQFHNEVCVDFFAMQFGKIAKIFEDAGCRE